MNERDSSVFSHAQRVSTAAFLVRAARSLLLLGDLSAGFLDHFLGEGVGASSQKTSMVAAPVFAGDALTNERKRPVRLLAMSGRQAASLEVEKPKGFSATKVAEALPGHVHKRFGWLQKGSDYSVLTYTGHEVEFKAGDAIVELQYFVSGIFAMLTLLLGGAITYGAVNSMFGDEFTTRHVRLNYGDDGSVTEEVRSQVVPRGLFIMLGMCYIAAVCLFNAVSPKNRTIEVFQAQYFWANVLGIPGRLMVLFGVPFFAGVGDWPTAMFFALSHSVRDLVVAASGSVRTLRSSSTSADSDPKVIVSTPNSKKHPMMTLLFAALATLASVGVLILGLHRATFEKHEQFVAAYFLVGIIAVIDIVRIAVYLFSREFEKKTNRLVCVVGMAIDVIGYIGLSVCTTAIHG